MFLVGRITNNLHVEIIWSLTSNDDLLPGSYVKSSQPTCYTTIGGYTAGLLLTIGGYTAVLLLTIGGYTAGLLLTNFSALSRNFLWAPLFSLVSQPLLHWARKKIFLMRGRIKTTRKADWLMYSGEMGQISSVISIYRVSKRIKVMLSFINGYILWRKLFHFRG